MHIFAYTIYIWIYEYVKIDNIPESMGLGPGSYVYRSTLNDKKNFNKVSSMHILAYTMYICIYEYVYIRFDDVPESMGLGPGSYVYRSTLNDKKNFNKVT
jgi:hypothetical protein